MLTKIVNGTSVAMSPDEEAATLAQWAATDAAAAKDLAANGYKHQRQQAYLDFGDQLDLLWHSMDSGEIPKSLGFYNCRLAVKQQYLKPVTNSNSSTSTSTAATETPTTTTT